MTCTDCRTEGADCLTADRVRVCSDCLYERVVKERDEARAEVERRVKEVVDARFLAMTLYSAAGGEDFVASLPHMMVEQIRQVRRWEHDLAYQRGAEAMREAAAQRVEVSPTHGIPTSMSYAYAEMIRALPIPEDKP